MRNHDYEQLSIFNIVHRLEYTSNAIVIKNIVVEDDCTIQGFAFDYGKVWINKMSPFLRFIHIIEGKAEMVIDDNSSFMHSGDSIIIPANSNSSLEANQKFKMLCTSIRSK